MEEPYKKAHEEIKRHGELPVKLGKSALLLGAGIASGTALSRVAPFLSQYIPEDLAIKGLSKLDPRFGKFISAAMAGGQTMDQIKDFIGQKASEGTNEAKEETNILAQYEPTLDQFIRHIMETKNLSPAKAAVHAELEPKLKKVIAQIKKDFKNKNFGEIVEEAYKNYKRTSLNPATSESSAAAQPTQPQSATQATAGQTQAQQPPQGDAAIMAAMQKILNM